MRVTNVALRVVAAAVWTLIASGYSFASTEAPCSAGTFETDAEKIAGSFELPQSEPALLHGVWSWHLTAEIDRIKNGAKGHYVGEAFNRGSQGWWGYDADRHLFVRISGATGRFAITSNERKLGALQAFRRKGEWNFLVTVVRATPQQAREFACRANELLNWGSVYAAMEKPIEQKSALEAKREPQTTSDSTGELAEIKLHYLPVPDRFAEAYEKPCPEVVYSDVEMSFGLVTNVNITAESKPDFVCDCSCRAAARKKYDELDEWIHGQLR